MKRRVKVEHVQYEGIMSKGFGLIPQLVMRDKTLSVEAKAIYAYFAAFAGNTHQAFPSAELICAELNISKKRYLKHRQYLIDKSYITVVRNRSEKGFSKNIYVLTQRLERNEHLTTLQKFYDDNIGKRDEAVNEQLRQLLERYQDPQLIIEALKIAVQHGKTLFPYAKGVLYKLATEKGITTYEQFIARHQRAKKPTSFGGHELPF